VAEQKQQQRISGDTLRAFIAASFEAVAIPHEDAKAIAQLMAQADINGSEGHGVFRLPQYIRRIKGGAVNVKPNIRVEREMAGMALVHGDNGMGHLVMKFATEKAIEKAKTAGVAWVGARWSNHAGPASLYASMPAQHNMIGLYMAVGSANHLPPWGGLDMLLSTNPIAVAVPAGDEPAIVLDMATTVAAYGKVKTKAQRGEMMPEGWMMDRQGNPLTDPKQIDFMITKSWVGLGALQVVDNNPTTKLGIYTVSKDALTGQFGDETTRPAVFDSDKMITMAHISTN
jgi:LDH2 family malate/lactate/ureidoglycolate dehydrogenase